MKKIPLLLKRENGVVTDQINPQCRWVFRGLAIPTQKFDGTACAIIDGELYKRYDAKLKDGKYKKPIPKNAISCQPPDPITGHHPHWVKCDRNNPADKWHWQAFDALDINIDGTYELCGEKVKGHKLIRHGAVILYGISTYPTLAQIKEFLRTHDVEGIVFYNTITGEMCKIRKKDFNFKR